MTELADAFAEIAGMVGEVFGSPYYDGAVISQATPGHDDDDGNWVPGDPATERPCKVQIDALDERMRPEGWTDKDFRFIILAASLTGSIDTDATVMVALGPFAGEWLVSSLEMDPAAIGWVGKGRRA